MRRIVSTLALTSGIAVAGILFAPVANADVSNPASNPAPITVTGDDGLTYTDGRDTLPGFDDEACTYIPGAYFDFQNNKVRYADGQSIPWTEWSRATGYQAWVAKNSAAAVPPPAPAAAPVPVAPAAAGKPTATTTKAQAGTTPTGVATSGGTAEVADAPSGAEDEQSEPATEASAQASAPSSSVGGADDTEVLAAGVVQPGAESVGSTAGLAILGGLFGLGGLAFAGYAFARRGTHGTVA